MKKIFLLVVTFFAVMYVNGAVYHFNITNVQGKYNLQLVLNDTGVEKSVMLDEKGQADVVLDNFKPQYAILKVGRAKSTLYLDPSDDLTISFDARVLLPNKIFTGKGAAVNSFISSKVIGKMDYNFYKLDEKSFLNKCDSLYNVNLSALKASGLSQEFIEKETIRLKYISYASLHEYPRIHMYFSNNKDFVPSENFNKVINSLSTYRADLLIYPEYKTFISESITTFSKVDRDVYDKFAETSKILNYVKDNVKDNKVAEYVVNSVVYSTVEAEGTIKTKKFINSFNQYVKSPVLIKKFNDLLSQWELINPGKQSPSFAYHDINGKLVKLEELKGKYVYIDMWATWCGPCCHELPYMKKLEEKYAGKDIYFVSISCDKDKKAWERKVKKDNLQGIQLNTEGDDSFMNAYFTKFIPRFVLLDKDGKIINPKMTKPSNKETTDTLDSLLK